MSDTKICECGKEFAPEQSSGDICFRCKLDGVGFSFLGGEGHGRKAFHGKTIGEVQRETLARGKAIGADLEPLPARKELI